MPDLAVQVVFDLPLDREFAYKIPEGLPPLEPGLRVKAPFGKGSKEGLILRVLDQGPEGLPDLKTLEKILDKEPLLGAWSLETAKWMARTYFCSLGEALFAMVPSARRERDLEDRNEVEETSDHELKLSEEQTLAVQTLMEGPEKYFYLRGITGSGKTEVFLQAARRVLDQGRQVVYLVPEIALTWQLRDTLQKRFGSQVAVLHSGLTPAQKLREWRRIRKGEAGLVVGARSAIFAPLAQPGLFIIDEEHEGGYKSGSTPRYHARQVALFLAGKTGAKVVMGSATPSLEAVHLMREGRLRTLSLTKRLAGGEAPPIQVVPLQGQKGILSPLLTAKIQETFAQGRQTVLFLNRRGFSSSFHCRTCGHIQACKNCSVSLTWHKKKGALLCHYCGWQTKVPSVCPECGSLDIGWFSIGTERVEEEIRNTFPQLKMERLDSDTAEKKGHAEQVLDDFRQGKIDLLLGTQMVAKGLNFPGLKLVGILQADQGLSMPDFRAAERIFDLIRQVSGRAGRYRPDGEVILQTFRPQSGPIRLAAAGQEEEFWTQELEIRKILGFPPFSRLIRLVFRSQDEDRARQTAEDFAQNLKAAYTQEEAEVLGPAECALGMVAQNHRYQILIRSEDFPRMHHGLKWTLENFPVRRQVYIEVDVDPLQMM